MDSPACMFRYEGRLTNGETLIIVEQGVYVHDSRSGHTLTFWASVFNASGQCFTAPVLICDREPVCMTLEVEYERMRNRIQKAFITS